MSENLDSVNSFERSRVQMLTDGIDAETAEWLRIETAKLNLSLGIAFTVALVIAMVIGAANGGGAGAFLAALATAVLYGAARWYTMFQLNIRYRERRNYFRTKVYTQEGSVMGVGGALNIGQGQ